MNKKTEAWKGIGRSLFKDGWNIFTNIALPIVSFIAIFWMPVCHKAIWLLSISILFLLILFWRIINNLIKKNIAAKELDIPTEIQHLIRYLYDNKKYIDVVRFGTISRFLWLNDNTIQRIDIGKMVEDSAGKIGKIKEQVSALIDDLGWTCYTVGDIKTAKANIKNGIDKATEHKLYYFAAKGERHLAGIESGTGNKSNIHQHLINAQEYAAQIKDESEKQEMEGSLFFANAEYSFENGMIDDAIEYITKARNAFKDDRERYLKTYSLLGNIYLAKNTDELTQKAKDEFNKGYNACHNERKNEYAKNAVGLAKVAVRELNIPIAIRYLKEAIEIFETSKKNNELNEAKSLLSKINTNHGAA